jgi:hypothetical protein
MVSGANVFRIVVNAARGIGKAAFAEDAALLAPPPPLLLLLASAELEPLLEAACKTVPAEELAVRDIALVLLETPSCVEELVVLSVELLDAVAATPLVDEAVSWVAPDAPPEPEAALVPELEALPCR